MNHAEYILFAVILIVLFFYFLRCTRQTVKSLLLTLLIGPALYLSLETASQFMTFDEIYIYRETADLDFHYVNQWYMGANRTSDAVLGAFSRFARAAFRPNDLDLKRTIKLAHFFIGFLALLCIHAAAGRWVRPPGGKALYSLVFFWCALLLPVAAVALKVFNYDLISMSLAVLALLLTMAALETRDRRRGIWAVVCAYLAAQEKTMATPVLLLCTALFGLIAAPDDGRRVRLGAILARDLAGISAALAAGLCSVAIVRLVGHGVFPRSFIGRVVEPFTSALVPFFRYFLGVNLSMEFSWLLAAEMLGASCAVVFAASLALLGIHRLLPRLRLPAAAPETFSAVAAVCCLAAGVLSTFVVHHHFCSFSPGTAFPFVHSRPFNGTITYFGASTIFGHVLSSIGYAYAVFVNAVPTAIWCMFGLCLFLRRWNGLPALAPPAAYLTLAALFFLPLFMGAAQVPLCNRYFNIFLLLFCCIVCVLWMNAVSSLSKPAARTAAGIMVALLLVEVIPFRPVYTAFRPFWSSYADSVPARTVGNPSWTGWGEEVMLAGKKIERMISGRSTQLCSSGKRTALYFFYPGDFLHSCGGSLLDLKLVVPDTPAVVSDAQMQLGKQGKTCQKSAVSYGCNDLFLLNRTDCITGPLVFPDEVPPLFTISYRGYPMAWVWQGDKLKQAGISFTAP